MDRQNAVRKDAHAFMRQPFFQPDTEQIAQSRMSRFTSAFEDETGARFIDYSALHAYSAREFRQFWKCFLESAEGLEWSGAVEPVCVGDDCESAAFFPNVTLNYAENLLNKSIAPDNAPALTSVYADGLRVSYTRGELRDRVMRIAHALQRMGLTEGDRVVGILRNDAEAITMALAAAAVGATLAIVAPEYGAQATIEHFAPLKPKMMFLHTTPRTYDTKEITGSATAVVDALPTLENIVYLDDSSLPSRIRQRLWEVRELISDGDPASFQWTRFKFDHPLCILQSSDVAGEQKRLVHGAGGTLIEHVKEHRLHGDFGPGDKLYVHTTCASMMWQWQLSALASGVELVTYDGPVGAIDSLWRLVAQERVTVFGTSPAYLKMCEDARIEPGKQYDFSALRTVLSVGAALYESQFEWVRDHVKALPLQLLEDGTDIMGSFVLGNPNLPIYAGEAQSKSLGLDVQAFDEHGQPVARGELVCANPFPSRPLGFYGDKDRSRFHQAYFAANGGAWTQGEAVGFSPQGSARLYGRSDGMLNVRGVEVSPGEVVRTLAGIPEIAQSMLVTQALTKAEETDHRFVLLAVLRPGVQLDATLIARMRGELTHRVSVDLVPEVIAQVQELPATHNGKLSAAAAHDAVNGLPARNVGSLANAPCLDAIRAHPALSLERQPLPAPGESLAENEAYLRALWEQHFCFAPIGRDDNFFDLGGHPLLAARMLHDVKRATGRTLPLSTFTVAPTIARFAGVLASGPDVASRASGLVHMRAGPGRPLFMIHAITGSVMESLTLAAMLKSDRPVYGVSARGIDGKEDPLNNVEEMARVYIRQIRAVQPHGPYALSGFSFGGLIVYEMAQQLVEAGEQIEMLCLIDAYVHESCLRLPDWIRYQGDMVALRVRTYLKLKGRARFEWFGQKARAAMDRVRMRMGKRPLRPALETLGLSQTATRVREAHRSATMTYRPREYSGSQVILVRATRVEEGRGNPLLVWKNIAKAGLKVVQVEGRHTDLVFEPLLGDAATVVGNALKKV
jgi:acetoacetyl-CoA synthetase